MSNLFLLTDEQMARLQPYPLAGLLLLQHSDNLLFRKRDHLRLLI